MFKNYCLSSLLILSVNFCANAQSSEADSLLRLLNKSAEDTNKVLLYGGLAKTVRSTDPAKAIEYGQKGILLSGKLGFNKGTAICYLNTSTAYIYSDKLDTALLYLDTALIYAHKIGEPNRLGLAYLNRADIYRQMQNFNQSLKDCETALKYADQANNNDVRARINQTLGSIYYRQENYQQAVIYYNKAAELYQKNGNLRMFAVIQNNLGLVYKSIKEYKKAVEVTTNAIHITDSLKDITNLSIYNGNLSNVYYQMEDYGQAEKYANRSMEYAVMQNNESLIASANLLLSDIYLKQGRLQQAIDLANKIAPFFKEDEDYQSLNLATDLLAEAYFLSGNYKKAYEFMRISGETKDTLAKQHYDDELAAMQTKFKVYEKDKEILLLAKDKELQEQKLQRQRLLMVGAVTIALLALFGIWLLMNRNKLRQRMKELELRNQIAADLHDEVGSSLSSIHMLSEMATQQVNDNTQKDILTRMSSNAKETMEKMGDIVWMIKPGETEAGSLKQRMERFAYEICSSRNITLQMQLGELEKVKLTMEQRKNIYLIFKETLNNAVKYSGTEKIEINASIQNKELILLVKDFGKGFDSNIVKRGNGLDNIQNRTKELRGKLEIGSSTEGTILKLVIPV